MPVVPAGRFPHNRRMPNPFAYVLLVCLFSAAPGLLAAADAHTTVNLTLHVVDNRTGTVGVIPSARLCSKTTDPVDCTIALSPGSVIRIVANAPGGGGVPGVFSTGTGGAAGCGTSTCSFTITSDAEATATFSSTNGTIESYTTTLAGDGGGEIGADNSRCQNFDPVQL